MRITERLGLILPDKNEVVNIEQLNQNFEKLEQSISEAGSGGSGGSAISIHVVLKKTGWMANYEFEDYSYSYTYRNQAITSYDAVEFLSSPDSVDIALKAGIGAVKSIDGGAVFYAAVAPTDDIEGTLLDWSAGSGMSGTRTDTITLLESEWVADHTYAGYGFSYTYSLKDVHEKDVVEFSASPDSAATAEAAGLGAVCSANGSVIFYAAVKPDSDIVGTLQNWSCTGDSSGGTGYTFTPHISEDGVLSWTNDGELENPEPVNIIGPAYKLTDSDIDRIVAAVIAALPVYNGEVG